MLQSKRQINYYVKYLEMMTHHSVMTSSLRIKKIVFLSDIDSNSKTDVFIDVIYLIINQCEPRRPYSVCQPRSASKRIPIVYIHVDIHKSSFNGKDMQIQYTRGNPSSYVPLINKIVSIS